MKRLLAGVLLFCLCGIAMADDTAFFKVGPLSLNIPLKTTSVTYLYDVQGNQNMVGGETPIISLWDKVEGTVGVVTSLDGNGTPFVGGNINVGNTLDKWVSLGPINIGVFGGYDFKREAAIFGPKAATKIW